MEVGYGRTRETGEKGIYNVVFAYFEEEVGRYAARAAVRLFLELAEGKSIEEIKQTLADEVQEMRVIRENVRFGPSTGSIVEEAESRDIPYIRLNDQSLVQLGYGVHQQRIQATTTNKTNMISVDIACEQSRDEKTSRRNGHSRAERFSHYAMKTNSKARFESVGYPVVIKPLDGNHGRGATVGIENIGRRHRRISNLAKSESQLEMGDRRKNADRRRFSRARRGQ